MATTTSQSYQVEDGPVELAAVYILLSTKSLREAILSAL